jgi:transcriptional regulator GlxA family with amidase domain
MKHICFFLPEGTVMAATLFGSIEIFEAANDYLMQTGKAPFYKISIIGVNVEQSLYNARFMIQADTVNYGDADPDLIIIPGLHWKNNFSIKENNQAINWIINKHLQGVELASLCTGSFFLAATGLLKGLECSTHWRGEELFRQMYPEVLLCPDKILTDNGGIYTSGGSQSSLNLILYLVEKYNGREIAVYCSKVLQLDIERNSQSPFMLFAGQKGHGDEVIKMIQEYIEDHIAEKINVDSLAGKFAMSKRSFIRRFKKATNNVPVEYIQKVKMESAKRGFETSGMNINDVMYSVGYTDSKSFRAIFKKLTGLTPLEYKTKFNHSGSDITKQVR